MIGYIGSFLNVNDFDNTIREAKLKKIVEENKVFMDKLKRTRGAKKVTYSSQETMEAPPSK